MVSSIGGLLIITVSVYAGSSIIEKRSFGHRSALWERSWSQIKDAPILGTGIGSWSVNNLNHSPDEKHIEAQKKLGVYKAGGDIFYERPHNDFLWIWSELGLIGLLTNLFLFCVAFFSAYQLLQKGNQKERLLYIISSATLISYLLIAFFSFPKERIEQNLIVLIYTLVLLYQSDQVSPKKFRVNQLLKYLGVVLLTLSVYSLYVAFNRSQSDYYMRNVIEAKRNKNWHLALLNAQKALTHFAPIASDGAPVYWYKGIAEMELNFTERAHQSFLNAYQLHPTHLYVLNNLATTYALFNQVDSAVFLYKKALKVNPLYEDARINLSGIYYNQGAIDSAWKEIEKISINSKQPQYPLFANTIIRSKFENQIHEEAVKKEVEEELSHYLEVEELIYFNAYRKAKESSVDFQQQLFKEMDLFIKKKQRENQ